MVERKKKCIGKLQIRGGGQQRETLSVPDE
jgi:hypothetical protein